MRTPLLIALLIIMPAAAAADSRDGHRIVAILDYIAGDYGGCVKNGKVVSKEEYKEQLDFVANARKLLAALKGKSVAAIRDGVSRGLEHLNGEILRKASPGEVGRSVSRVRRTLVEGLGLVTGPTRTPSLARAKKLFVQACAPCHGLTGLGDGEKAKELKPPPASFHDPGRMEAITPYRIYNAITFGLTGTAMASFEESLAPHDRWSLAFYVSALRHQKAAAAAKKAPRLPLLTLASSDDATLRGTLEARGIAKEAVASTLAALRARTAFEPTNHGRLLAQARELLSTAQAAFRRGDIDGARRAAIDAYLKGFDPLEALLRTRAPEIVPKVESAFVALRAALEGGDPGRVTSLVQSLRVQLDQSDRVLSDGRGGTAVSFIGGFLVLFREGLEAALLIGALLGLLARMGEKRAARWVHYGWLAALAAGAATYAVAHGLLRVGAEHRETLEGVLSLLAACVLFYVSYWLVSNSDVQRWMSYLKEKLRNSVGRPRGLWAVAALSFVAVYREAFETVLFYQAMLLDEGTMVGAVLGGAAVAALALVVSVWLIFRVGRRLPLTAFFLASGVLLCILAAVLGGKGIHALQEAGHIPFAPMAGPRVDWLGLYPDVISIAVQSSVVVALVAAGGITWARHARNRRAKPLAP